MAQECRLIIVRNSFKRRRKSPLEAKENQLTSVFISSCCKSWMKTIRGTWSGIFEHSERDFDFATWFRSDLSVWLRIWISFHFHRFCWSSSTFCLCLSILNMSCWDKGRKCWEFKKVPNLMNRSFDCLKLRSTFEPPKWVGRFKLNKINQTNRNLIKSGKFSNAPNPGVSLLKAQ